MKTSRATHSIFISHSRHDDELVRDIARRLRDVGLSSFVDFKDISLGTEWKKTLREQLRKVDTVLVLVTPAALRSPWIMTELGMAEGLGRDIIPVTVGLKPRDLPAPLQSYQAVPFDQLDSAINELSDQSDSNADD